MQDGTSLALFGRGRGPLVPSGAGAQIRSPGSAGESIIVHSQHGESLVLEMNGEKVEIPCDWDLISIEYSGDRNLLFFLHRTG